MNVLFIGPLPPPVTGQSFACERLLADLKPQGRVDVVNLSRPALRSGMMGGAQIRDVLGKLKEVWRQRKGRDLVYLTVSESLAGNIKDLLIYVICFPQLSRMMIHLHGGSLRKDVFGRSRLLFALNRYFIRKLGSIVILGESHRPIFADFVRPERLHVCANFADDAYFVTEAVCRGKFVQHRPLRVLYLSNFVEGKGHRELLEAYCSLPAIEQSLIAIDFAGGFETEEQKAAFLERISRLPNIRYHGIVGGPIKQQLLAQAQVFCLPTQLSEGQPISILEAYASGCVVLTTNKGGIPDVFRAPENGIELAPGSVDSTRLALQELLIRDDLEAIGARNWCLARSQFRLSMHLDRMRKLMERLPADVAA